MVFCLSIVFMDNTYWCLGFNRLNKLCGMPNPNMIPSTMAPATSKVSIPFEEESALSLVKIICRVKNSCSGHKRKDTGKQINCHRHRACRSKNACHYRKAQCRDKRWKHNTHIKLNHYIVDDPAKCSCKTAVKQLLFWSGKITANDNVAKRATINCIINSIA